MTTPPTTLAAPQSAGFGFRRDLTSEDYHADRVLAGPTLSRSCAKTLLERSPLHAKLEHPRFGGQSKQPDARMVVGSAIHALVLGKGATLAVGEWDEWRKDAAKEFREAALRAGRLPLTPSQNDEAKAAASAIREQLDALGMPMFFRDGESELIAAFEDDGVACRVQFDNLHAEPEMLRASILDLKSTGDASLAACERRIGDGMLALQQAFYSRAVEVLLPQCRQVKFAFIFLETEPPYAIQPVQLSGAWLEIGRAQYRRALATWKQCLSTGVWPAYATAGQMAIAEPRPWEMTELEAGQT